MSLPPLERQVGVSIWSSFRQWATGCEGTVEIESQWTARKRERMGITLTATRAQGNPHPPPKPGGRVGATSREVMSGKGWASPQPREKS